MAQIVPDWSKACKLGKFARTRPWLHLSDDHICTSQITHERSQILVWLLYNYARLSYDSPTIVFVLNHGGVFNCTVRLFWTCQKLCDQPWSLKVLQHSWQCCHKFIQNSSWLTNCEHLEPSSWKCDWAFSGSICCQHNSSLAGSFHLKISWSVCSIQHPNFRSLSNKGTAKYV